MGDRPKRVSEMDDGVAAWGGERGAREDDGIGLVVGGGAVGVGQQQRQRRPWARHSLSVAREWQMVCARGHSPIICAPQADRLCLCNRPWSGSWQLDGAKVVKNSDKAEEGR